MKLSKYTFLFDVNKKEFYAYNTLSNALMEIDEQTYTLLRAAEGGTKLSEDRFDKELYENKRFPAILMVTLLHMLRNLPIAFPE